MTRVRPYPTLRGRAAISAAELTRASCLTRQGLHRLLSTNGVLRKQHGRFALVPTSELELRLPLFWESLLLIERLYEAFVRPGSSREKSVTC